MIHPVIWMDLSTIMLSANSQIKKVLLCDSIDSIYIKFEKMPTNVYQCQKADVGGGVEGGIPEGRKTFGRCAYIHYLDCSDCLKGVKNYQILL